MWLHRILAQLPQQENEDRVVLPDLVDLPVLRAPLAVQEVLPTLEPLDLLDHQDLQDHQVQAQLDPAVHQARRDLRDRLGILAHLVPVDLQAQVLQDLVDLQVRQEAGGLLALLVLQAPQVRLGLAVQRVLAALQDRVELQVQEQQVPQDQVVLQVPVDLQEQDHLDHQDLREQQVLQAQLVHLVQAVLLAHQGRLEALEVQEPPVQLDHPDRVVQVVQRELVQRVQQGLLGHRVPQDLVDHLVLRVQLAPLDQVDPVAPRVLQDRQVQRELELLVQPGPQAPLDRLGLVLQVLVGRQVLQARAEPLVLQDLVVLVVPQELELLVQLVQAVHQDPQELELLVLRVLQGRLDPLDLQVQQERLDLLVPRGLLVQVLRELLVLLDHQDQQERELLEPQVLQGRLVHQELEVELEQQVRQDRVDRLAQVVLRGHQDLVDHLDQLELEQQELQVQAAQVVRPDLQALQVGVELQAQLVRLDYQGQVVRLVPVDLLALVLLVLRVLQDHLGQQERVQQEQQAPGLLGLLGLADHPEQEQLGQPAHLERLQLVNSFLLLLVVGRQQLVGVVMLLRQSTAIMATRSAFMRYHLIRTLMSLLNGRLQCRRIGMAGLLQRLFTGVTAQEVHPLRQLRLKFQEGLMVIVMDWPETLGQELRHVQM